MEVAPGTCVEILPATEASYQAKRKGPLAFPIIIALLNRSVDAC